MKLRTYSVTVMFEVATHEDVPNTAVKNAVNLYAGSMANLMRERGWIYDNPIITVRETTPGADRADGGE